MKHVDCRQGGLYGNRISVLRQKVDISMENTAQNPYKI